MCAKIFYDVTVAY